MAGRRSPTWSDVTAVANAIRNLGHKVALLYAPDWYWSEQGSPTMAGAGFDLVAAEYGRSRGPPARPRQVYAARGGDASPDWKAYGGLTPVLLQFSCQTTWGNKQLDMNAYRGDPAVLDSWFTIWNKETTVATLPLRLHSAPMVSMEQMEAKKTVKNLHPEFWRRCKALMEYGAANGGADRSSAQAGASSRPTLRLDQGWLRCIHGNTQPGRASRPTAVPPALFHREHRLGVRARGCRRT